MTQDTPTLTPGPWETSRDGVPATWQPQFTVYSAETGTRVATVFESEANAWLIEAAPDLLRELREMVEVTVRAESGDYDDEDVRDALIGARAAIAKAEGKDR